MCVHACVLACLPACVTACLPPWLAHLCAYVCSECDIGFARLGWRIEFASIMGLSRGAPASATSVRHIVKHADAPTRERDVRTGAYLLHHHILVVQVICCVSLCAL